MGGALLLAVTNRPAVSAFLSSVAQLGGRGMVVAQVHLEAVARDDDLVAAADLAVVDAGLDPAAAIGICRVLRLRRPGLPVAALFCCRQSVSSWCISELVACGVLGFVDMRASTEEVLRALERVQRGDVVMHLQLDSVHRELWRLGLAVGDRPSNASAALSDSTRRLLELLAEGLSDQEMGHILARSPHTVKHQIERLRRQIGVRNRVELAAWAGRHGLYESAPPTDTNAAAPDAPEKVLAAAGGVVIGTTSRARVATLAANRPDRYAAPPSRRASASRTSVSSSS